jgi:Glycosyl hydrolases family 31
LNDAQFFWQKEKRLDPMANLPYNCLQKLRATDSTPNDTVFDCGQDITLAVNSPLPNVFCLSVRLKMVRSGDVPPRDLESMREPLELDIAKNSWVWKQGDVHLSLNEEGFTLTRFGTVAIKTAPIAITSSEAGIALTLQTSAMGNAHTWPIPAPHLQGTVVACGLYGGVGAIAADGITCKREGDFTTVSTLSPAIDFLFVAGTPIETSNQISLLAGRVVPPSIWAYGLGLAPTYTEGDANPGALRNTLKHALALRAEGFPVDVILPTDELALDNHGRFALFTEEKALEDMELHKHLEPLRTNKIKIVPRITASLKNAVTMAAEWNSRGLMTEDKYLPNVHSGPVISQVTERLESVFKHGIDAAQLVGNPALEAPNTLFLAWKRIVYAASMRWHGEGADRRAITFATHTLPTKAGTLGVTLEVDCSSYEGIAKWLDTMLTASHSGTVLMASRLNVENASQAMLQRLAPLSALMPICWISDAQTLLNASDDTKAVWKLWSNYRLKLLPYIAGIVEEASRNGLPALRSMRLAFPRDAQAANHFAHQYLLGPSLLVAPLLHDQAETTVWLPAGEKWYHLPTGTKFEGGQAIIVPVEAGGIAVFGREGHVLCIGPDVAGAPSINTIKPVTDAWLFGLPNMDPCVTGIRVKVMQMQGNAYIKGLEGTKVVSTVDYTVSRRGAEVKVVKRR